MAQSLRALRRGVTLTRRALTWPGPARRTVVPGTRLNGVSRTGADLRSEALNGAVAPAGADRPLPVRATGGALVVVAIVLVAVNLRTAVTGLGALLDEVGVGLQLSPAYLGAVATLPTIAFAAFGAVTPRLTRRFEITTLLVIAMVLLTLGQLARALTSSTAVFMVTSAAALAGIAVANILLPAVVKRYFPRRVGALTGVYTMAMVGGGALAAAVSVPVAAAGGSWRYGIGVWAVLAAVAIIPAVALHRAGTAAAGGVPVARPPSSPPTSPPNNPPVRPTRTRLGWAMATFFGLQSFSAYALMGWLPQIFKDAGFSPQAAGLLLAGVIVGGMPMALLIPTLAARRADQRTLVVVLAATMVAAYVGLAVAPRAGALVWMVLLAVGQGAFPLVLGLIGLRSRTAAGTVALSTFTQSAGYLLASLGTFSIGMIYEATSGWLVPIAVLIVAMLIQAWAGRYAGSPRTLEDEPRWPERWPAGGRRAA